MQPTAGHVITAPVSLVKKINCDEVWQITRSDKVLPGTVWVPELAPGWDLFNRYLHEWKELPPNKWWPLYKDIFVRELQLEEKLGAMRRLWSSVNSGKVIALVCFCPNEAYCHRTLVAHFLGKYGIKTKEYKETQTSTKDDNEAPIQIVLF